MPNRNSIEIDHKHCKAICKEVGDRLRVSLSQQSSELPSPLQTQLEQLRGLDQVESASIVPAATPYR